MPDSLKTFLDYKDSLLNIKLIQLQDSLALKKTVIEPFFGIKEDWWTHVILPIGIPVLSYFLLWIRDKRKQLKDLKKQEDFLFTWIDLIVEPMKKQTDAYISFATQLNDLEIAKDGLGKYNLSTEKLQHYNSEQLVNLFVTSRKGNKEELNKLLFTFENSVTFIRRKQDFVASIFDELKLVYGETSVKWNENFSVLRKVLHEIGIEYSGQSNKVFTEILAIHGEYTSGPNEGMKAAIENLIDKIGPIANEYIKVYTSNKLMRELVEPLAQLKHIYQSRVKHFQEISRLMIEAAEKMDDNYKKIQAVKTKLQTHPFKNFLFI